MGKRDGQGRGGEARPAADIQHAQWPRPLVRRERQRAGERIEKVARLHLSRISDGRQVDARVPFQQQRPQPLELRICPASSGIAIAAAPARNTGKIWGSSVTCGPL